MMSSLEFKAADIEKELLPCNSCGRTFLPDALSKHSKVCEKTLMKKRKTFDSSKQRLQGTDLEVYANLTPQLSSVTKGKKKDDLLPNKLNTSSSKWKEKHQDIAKTIQTAKKTINMSSSVTAAVAKPSDHQQCPHCDRYFGPKAYGRHVEWCKEQQLKSKHTNINVEARERLHVRTGYRAPLPNKVLTRDKYQSGGRRSRDPSLTKADATKPKVNEPVNRSQTFSITTVKVQKERSRSNTQIVKSPMVVKRNKNENVIIAKSTNVASTKSPKIITKSSSSEKSDDLPESVDNKESVDKKSVGNATIDSAYSSLTRVLSEGDSTKVEQARFCHECGTQYPVPVAKFCCYCGMRRITL